jgi:dihydroxyacid dehydratase/phosphogluconate dehydratase
MRRIGIASTWSQVTPCNIHIDKLAIESSKGADATGGKGIIFNTITIDAVNNRIDVNISAEEITKRKAAWTQPAPRYTHGVPAKYAKLVSTASEDAVTDKYL